LNFLQRVDRQRKDSRPVLYCLGLLQLSSSWQQPLLSVVSATLPFIFLISRLGSLSCCHCRSHAASDHASSRSLPCLFSTYTAYVTVSGCPKDCCQSLISFPVPPSTAIVVAVVIIVIVSGVVPLPPNWGLACIASAASWVRG